MLPERQVKIGDLVTSRLGGVTGVVVGFNEKGEGGQDFVHILVDGDVIVCMSFDVRLVKDKSGTAINRNI